MKMLHFVISLILLVQITLATHGDSEGHEAGVSGILSITLHYPDSQTNGNTYFLVTSDLTGWSTYDVIILGNETVIVFKEDMIMNKSKSVINQWTFQVVYPYTYYDQTILILIFVVDNSSESDSYNTGVCNPPSFNSGKELGQGRNVLLSGSGVTSVDLYPYFCVTSGEVLQMAVPALNYKGGGEDNVLIPVYVPPSLVENYLSRVTNVLILYDGQSLNISLLPTLISIAAVSGGLPELVVVGIPSTANRMAELTPTSCVADLSCVYMPVSCYAPTGRFNDTLSFALDHALPSVLSRLGGGGGLRTERRRTGSVGWSLGGLSACEAVFMRNDAITRGLCGSPSMWWNCGDFMRRHVVHPKDAKLWMDAGNGETPIELSTTDVYRALSQIDGWSPGSNLIIKIDHGGQHEISSWIQWDRLVEGLKFLFDEDI